MNREYIETLNEELENERENLLKEMSGKSKEWEDGFISALTMINRNIEKAKARYNNSKKRKEDERKKNNS